MIDNIISIINQQKENMMDVTEKTLDAADEDLLIETIENMAKDDEPDLETSSTSDIDNQITQGLSLIMRETAHYQMIIDTAKTEIKRKIFRKKIKKLQKEMQALLYMQQRLHKARTVDKAA